MKKKPEEKVVKSETGKKVVTLNEKLKRLDSICGAVNEKFKKTVIGKLSDKAIREKIEVTFIPSASPEFNSAVGGGFPRGKISIISGVEDCGKMIA